MHPSSATVFAFGAVLAVLLAVLPHTATSQRTAEEAATMSCATFLGDNDGSRTRIAGMYLWEFLTNTAPAVSQSQAGSAIALVGAFRNAMDEWCDDPGEAMSPENATVTAAALVATQWLAEGLKTID